MSGYGSAHSRGRGSARRVPFDAPRCRLVQHMPELPEVEVTRRQIAPLLVGRTIAQAAVTANSYFFLTRPDALARALRGRRVVGLERRGKYLVADFGTGDRLLLHLGMTGQLFAAGAASPRLLVST